MILAQECSLMGTFAQGEGTFAHWWAGCLIKHLEMII